MIELELQANTLAQSIKESNEYNQYHTLLNQIKQDNNLYQQVNEFRKKSFFLSIHEEKAFDEMLELKQEYDSILLLDEVKDFLAAEQKLVKLARSINNVLVSAFDLEIDFLDQE